MYILLLLLLLLLISDRVRRGGGVLIAVYNKSRDITLLHSGDSYGESVYCSIRLQSKMIINLVVFYRPPQEVSLENLDQLINENKNSYPTIYVGDFNLPDIDWSTGKGFVKPMTLRKSLHEHALRIFEANNLIQLVHEKTHVKGNTLDLVLVENQILDDLQIKCEVLPPISDHNMILLPVNIQDFVSKNSRESPKSRLNFNKADYTEIKKKFKELHESFNKNKTKTAIEYWDAFRQTINESIDEHVPVHWCKPRGKLWMD